MALLVLGLVGGCATPPLETARQNFYLGRLEQAEQNLADLPPDGKDRSLHLMERGMIRHAALKLDDSNRDWRGAAERDAWLETYSVSEGGASLLVNDRLLSFRGAPYERTLVYAFLAQNYLAQENWDYAAICARNIIRHMENRNGFPELAYGRYLAAFCLEMIADYGNAAIQYKHAAALLTNSVKLEVRNGRLGATADAVPAVEPEATELVCFVALGRIPSGEAGASYYGGSETPYAELHYDGRYLGRSYTLDNTARLVAETAQRQALLQAAKDATRLAVKTVVVASLEQQNDGLGALAQLILFGLEAPDTRRWETLPRWLQVARVPCPEALDHFTVVFKNSAGLTTGTRLITRPLAQQERTYISFCRDLP